jgi:RNA polymerase sigma-70 factor (ECF subfamily)
MNENNRLAEGFEANRSHLQAVAYRMLGSRSEAEDAVQEAWLRLCRADRDDVANLGGWLTTVVARICLDMLRARKSRREEPLEGEEPEQVRAMLMTDSTDPEREAALADSVGVALLVVLQMLAPAERVAFVLHDMFDLSFEEIGPIVGRTPTAARQLASRARRRVHGGASLPEGELTRQRQVVDAYLAASRAGDFEGLLAVLDPDVVLHADRAVLPAGAPQERRTAAVVARGALAARARHASVALINGSVGLLVVRENRVWVALSFTFEKDRITAIDVIADPDRLAALDIAVLE